MEYNKCLLFLAVSAMGLVSCSVKNNDLAAKQETGGIRLEVADFVDVDGIFAKDDAKSTFSYDSKKGFVFSWTQGDEIGIFPIAYRTPGDEIKPQQMMMVVDTGSGSTLSGAGYNGSTVGWSVSGDILYASYYPMQENYDLLPDNIILDYSGQKQIGNDIKGEKMRYLGAYDYLYTAPTTPNDVNDIKFSFQHAGAIVRFRVPTETAGTFTSLTVTAAGTVFPAKMELNLLTTEISSVKGTLSNTFTVNLENFEKTEDNYLNVWCMMPPVDLSGETLTVSFVKGTAARNINYEVSGRNLEAGKAYSFNGTDATIPDFIDLGLPSGTLWASWNVGATSPEEPGTYCCWGETMDEALAHTNFSSGSYHVNDDGRYNTATSLYPEDDIAYTTYGANYCIPDREQWEELISICYWTTETVNGKNCLKCQGCNGNFIILPFGGKKSAPDDIDVSSTTNGYYWTIERNPSAVNNVYYYHFTGTKNSILASAAYYGYLVRAVKVEKTTPTTYVDFGLPSGNLWSIEDLAKGNKQLVAWGQSTLYETSTFSSIQPSSYSFYSPKPAGGTGWTPDNNNKLTKYTTNSDSAFNGEADNNTILDAQDDIASNEWGSQWRIPTKADWQELYDYCNWELIDDLWKVSKNGKFILLKNINTNVYSNPVGYWSSTLYTDSSNPTANHSAYFVGFKIKSYDKDKSDIAIHFNETSYRFKPRFIRPICGGTSHANE